MKSGSGNEAPRTEKLMSAVDVVLPDEGDYVQKTYSYALIIFVFCFLFFKKT